jgi:DNA-binding transcriptional regulator LsrR (DeoR family)
MSDKSKRPNIDKTLKTILKRLDILAVVHLAKAGCTRLEVAQILGVSEDTIERMLPFKKLKTKAHEE